MTGTAAGDDDKERADTETMTDTRAKLDADLMKQVNRQFVTGVTVVTVMDGDRPWGLP